MDAEKTVVREFLATFSSGDIDAIMALLTDDATWWVSGRIAGMSGESSKANLETLLRQVAPLYVEGALRITPVSMISEGNRVAVEAESHAELVNGRIYANQYHFLFEVQGNRINRVREYSDTQHMMETFSA